MYYLNRACEIQMAAAQLAASARSTPSPSTLASTPASS